MSKSLKIFLTLLFVISYFLFPISPVFAQPAWCEYNQTSCPGNLYPSILNIIEKDVNYTGQEAAIYLQRAVRIVGKPIDRTIPGPKSWVGLILGASDLILQASENLIYGLIASDSTGHFLKLQTLVGSDKFLVDYQGKTTAKGTLKVEGTADSRVGSLIVGATSLPSPNPLNLNTYIFGQAKISQDTYLATESGKNVSIGTTSLSQKLMVAGNISAAAQLNTGQIQVGNYNLTDQHPEAIGLGALYFNSSITGNYVKKMFYSTAVGTTSWREMGEGQSHWCCTAGCTPELCSSATFIFPRDPTQTKVGIGTNQPQTRLYVKSPTGSGKAVFQNSSIWGVISPGSSADSYFLRTQESTSDRIKIKKDGSLIIGEAGENNKIDTSNGFQNISLNTGVFHSQSQLTIKQGATGEMNNLSIKKQFTVQGRVNINSDSNSGGLSTRANLIISPTNGGKLYSGEVTPTYPLEIHGPVFIATSILINHRDTDITLGSPSFPKLEIKGNTLRIRNPFDTIGGQCNLPGSIGWHSDNDGINDDGIWICISEAVPVPRSIWRKAAFQ